VSDGNDQSPRRMNHQKRRQHQRYPSIYLREKIIIEIEVTRNWRQRKVFVVERWWLSGRWVASEKAG